MFTNPDLYKGDTYDQMEKNKEKKEAFEKAMKQQAEFCAKNEPKVGQPVKGSRYNMTSNFNYKLQMKRIDYSVVYGAFGDISDPNHVMMDPRDCEAVDCMNPCYGENQYGACNKCTMYLFQNQGKRHPICNLCVLPTH